jgi:hypothetical protein
MKRWRKDPRATGLARVVQGIRGWHLCEDGKTIAWVSPVPGSYGHKWYWYGFGQNTYGRPVDTAKEAMQQVKDYIKTGKSDV